MRYEISLLPCMLSEVYHNVAIEPHLQPLNGEGFHHKSANTDENSHLDIRARGFWNHGQDAYFDVSTLMLQATVPWTYQQYTTDTNQKKSDNIING